MSDRDAPVDGVTPTPSSAADAPLLRPADAARQLGIPASTLRRWSRRFAPFLSPAANGRVHENGARGHRRYTPRDLEVLARCKALLSEGRTFEQTTQALEQAFAADAPVIIGEIETAEPAAQALPVDAEQAVPELGEMLAQALSTLSGSQQMLITGQQTERELLGLVLQDNFNLKEENKKLRERMVETERRIFEMKREMDQARAQERERMRQMEAYLFQLQRQMDDLVRRQTPVALMPSQPSASPPPAVADAPAPAGEAAASSSQQPAPAKKRSFWQWLLGR